MNLKAALINNYEYTNQEAELMINDLEKLDSRIISILEAWKETAVEDNTEEYHGHSINSLRHDYGMNFFAALTTLDWVIKDPENALPALAQGVM